MANNLKEPKSIACTNNALWHFWFTGQKVGDRKVFRAKWGSKGRRHIKFSMKDGKGK